jgi:uncharacterized protein
MFNTQRRARQRRELACCLMIAVALNLASCKPAADLPLAPAQSPAAAQGPTAEAKAPAAGQALIPDKSKESNPLIKQAADGVLELDWLALMSDSDRKRMESGDWMDENDAAASHPGEEGSFSTNMAQRQIKGFSAISDFDHKRVRVAGYFVPLEQTPVGVVTEILFVPYFGACIHVPPPPANQIIYAKLDKEDFELSMFNAYWLEGTIVAQTNDRQLAVSGYTMTDASLKLWE